MYGDTNFEKYTCLCTNKKLMNKFRFTTTSWSSYFFIISKVVLNFHPVETELTLLLLHLLEKLTHLRGMLLVFLHNRMSKFSLKRAPGSVATSASSGSLPTRLPTFHVSGQGPWYDVIRCMCAPLS